jgi:hypothetical protein
MYKELHELKKAIHLTNTFLVNETYETVGSITYIICTILFTYKKCRTINI